MNRYIITHMQKRIFSFLMQEDRAVEIHCDNKSAASLLGNIYIGRVKNIAANLDAAFLEIGGGTVCYLPLSELQHPFYTKKGSSPKLQAGDELMVQVSREPIKTKFPSVTTNITLHGKYILLTTGKTQISASSKLEKEEKERLSGLVRELEAELLPPASEPVSTAEPPGNHNGAKARPFGWLLRTNAGGIGRELLLTDMRRLADRYFSLIHTAPYRPVFTCLLQRPAAWIARLSDLYQEAAEQILTDDPEIYRSARDYLASVQPEDLEKLSLCEDSLLPLPKRFSLERQLTLALSEKVWLNSGGYLIIQPTEALTVIDVNSGKYEGGKNHEKAIRKINREAAAEAARQIRVRNLSGIIVIDFINMESDAENRDLMGFLDQELRRDPIRTVLVDMTKLSLVEITRMKKERPLAEECAGVHLF